MAGNLYVVAAPSGAGKTTLVRLLLEREPAVHLSISFTTRVPRPGEQDGREYHFVAVDRFKSMIFAGEFLEWAERETGWQMEFSQASSAEESHTVAPSSPLR